MGAPPEISEILGADAKLRYAVPGLTVPIPGDPGPSRCDVFALVEIEKKVCGIGVFATDDGFGGSGSGLAKRGGGRWQGAIGQGLSYS